MAKSISTPNKRRSLSRDSLQYPNVVQPISDGWEVLFVATTRPHRVADFRQREMALAYALRRNRHWRLEQDALLQTKALLFDIQKRLDNQSKESLRWIRFERFRGALRRFWSIG